MSVEQQATPRTGDRTVQTTPFARWARQNALQIGIVFVAIFIWLLFLLGSPQTFLAAPIYNSFMSTTPYFAIMALPLTLLIIAKEIDLCFPSIMAWGMTAFALVLGWTNNGWLALIACLAAGLFAGWLNGWIVVRIGIPSIVATIGTGFFWAGVVLVVLNGTGRSLVPVKGTLIDTLLVGRIQIGQVQVPAQFIWTVIVAVTLWFLLNRHRFGAHVYLTGDNQDSARLMGVNVDRVKVLCFSLVGVLAAFAGLISSLDLAYFWPTMGAPGSSFLLFALASVFMGGTSVFGGVGTIFGTFVGAFIIGSINAGIVAAGISGFYVQMIYGLIIVVSAGLFENLRRRLR